MEVDFPPACTLQAQAAEIEDRWAAAVVKTLFKQSTTSETGIDSRERALWLKVHRANPKWAMGLETCYLFS